MPAPRYVCILLTLLAAAAASPARAQEAQGDPLRLQRSEFQQHAAALDLTPAQRAAAEGAFAAYEREFDDAHKMQRDASDWIWSHTDSFDWYAGSGRPEFEERLSVEARAAQRVWEGGARALEARWFDGLRRIAIGRDDAIDALHRQRLRTRVLTTMYTDPLGAMTDVVSIAAEFEGGFTSSDAARQILLEYELELDGLLREFDAFVVGRRERMDAQRNAQRAAEARGEDPAPHIEARIDEMVRSDAIGQRLWNLHDQAARRLQPLVTAERQADFADRVHASLHRYLYSREEDMMAEKVIAPETTFATTLARDDLNASQRERIEALRETHRAARHAATPALYKAYMVINALEPQREFYRGYFGSDPDQKKAAMRDLNARNDAWKSTRAEWTAHCDDVIGKLTAILGETAAATQAASP